MSGREPLVTVVIPTYNRAHMVERAIASVLRQTVSDLEVVVVDDRSQDNTEHVVKRIADPRVRYIRHETNKRLPAVRNTGIANARGRYVAFLDDDDEWKEYKLEKQLEVIGKSEAVLCASTRTGSRSTNGYRGDWVTKETLRRGNIFDPSSLLVKTEVVRELEFDTTLPNGIGEDWDMFIRIAVRGAIRYVSDSMVIYNDSLGFQRITNRQANMSIEQLEGQMRVLEKHRAYFGPFWFKVHTADTLLSYIRSRSGGRVRRIAYAIRRCGASAVAYVLLRRVYRHLWGR